MRCMALWKTVLLVMPVVSVRSTALRRTVPLVMPVVCDGEDCVDIGDVDPH